MFEFNACYEILGLKEDEPMIETNLYFMLFFDKRQAKLDVQVKVNLRNKLWAKEQLWSRHASEVRAM